MRAQNERGQAVVEAAFLIPVLCCLVLLLLQPGILLYDRMVMNAAASDACRLLATSTSAAGDMAGSAKAFVLHRLGAVPETAVFHVHEGGCSWDVQLQGNESSNEVSVTIKNQVQPLPLIDAACHALGVTGGGGTIELQVCCTAQTQPNWVQSAGINPANSVGKWCQ